MAGRARFAVTAAVAVAIVSTALAGPVSARGNEPVPSARLIHMIAEGRPVLFHDAVVTGDFNLERFASVPVPIVCRGCTFRGRILGSHVQFERPLDLAGSTVNKSVDIEGARFQDAVLLGSLGVPTTLKGEANFAFTTFEDLADFAGVHFLKSANFTAARFRDVSRFSSAMFDGPATFSVSRFDREALFGASAFTGVADFEGGLFGSTTDFRGSQFLSGVNFASADITGRADYSRSVISGPASFDDARFGGDAVFVGVGFSSPAVPVASFDTAAIADSLDFDAAVFDGPVQLHAVSAGSLSFARSSFADPAQLWMDDLTIGTLVLSLKEVQRVDQDVARRVVLEHIESTAKANGNLGLANDARYQLQVLASQDDWFPRNVADRVGYRWVAGYFVRPWRPLVWLLVFVLLFALVRTFYVEGRVYPWGDWRSTRVATRFVKAMAYTVTPSGVTSNPPHRRLELLFYAFLLACFVLALANTNPTLRDMVDAIF